MASVLWPLGEIDRARLLSEELTLRIAHLSNVASISDGNTHRVVLEMIRRDFGRAEPHVQAVLAIARDGKVDKWPGSIVFFEGWREWQVGDREAGVKRMRQAVSMFAEQNFVLGDGLFKAVLAEAEAEGGEIDAALSTIESAIAVSERTGQRLDDAEAHRVRGEILLKQNPADPAPAEAAFLAAIAVAQQQKARSFELRAALSLAKLYQSTGRPIDAHDVLGPALAGFSPTPEFPTIAEAKALFEVLAHL